MIKYRLEIITGIRGIDRDHLLWKWFPRLIPSYQTPLLTIYAATGLEDISTQRRQVMDGFVEEGDILAYVCEPVEE